MKKYEAMFILKPDLGEEAKKTLYNQISEQITKNSGSIIQADVWAEKRKLFFPIKKCLEGLYYLANFNAPPEAISKLKQAYKINEDILRVLITVRE
ncbi:MAG: 30S ribosomal protein S6 [Candidatus Omnitrophica bacterium]|jgi:small subunit ribosomal protein S6|nr:30S ribosomal protein S6 [Candidatus Omnitrophota bacterium]MDD5513104.1 30S ribosomal protein S6 [Candidatus Omnitrophota bacterium]